MRLNIISNVLALCLFIAFISISLGQDFKGGNSCNLHIQLFNIPDSTYLYLSKGNDATTIDSILFLKGIGDYQIKLNYPTQFEIINYDFTNRKYNVVKNLQYKSFWLENSSIKMIGDYHNLRSAKIYGSVSDSIAEQYLTISDKFKTKLDSLNKIVNEIKNKPKLRNIKQKITSVKKERENEMMKYFIKNSDSYVVLPALSLQCIYDYLSKKEILKIYNNLSGQLKKSETAEEIKHFTTLPSVPRVGDKCINFKQFNTKGEKVSLSQYYGKYILLDFWSSGCYPCRFVENPILVKLYDKYHPLGLDIIGISQDTDKEKWIKAIKEDKLSWVNVSDLKGWFNEPSLLYGINGVPTEILINKKGIIIYKKVGGNNNLDKKLAEIFGK